MMILLQMIVGMLLMILLWAGRYAVRATAYRTSRLRPILPFLPTISFGCALVYALWLLHTWFSENPLYQWMLFICIAVSVMLFAWFVLRDVVAGAIFTGRGQFLINNSISFGNLSGKIISRGSTHLAVRTDKGEITRIPYSRLSGEVVSERSEEMASAYYRIRLHIPKREDPERLQAAIGRDVLSIPWVSCSTAPVVRFIGERESGLDFEVLFQSLNPRHAALVEHALRINYADDPVGLAIRIETEESGKRDDPLFGGRNETH